MARRSEHSLEEIKEMVLAAAETIVVEDGFTALTMRKIAMEIGYTVGSIYMVFDNMSDLVLHINARTLIDLAEKIKQAEGQTPDQCIEAMAIIYLCYASQNFNRWSLIFEHKVPKDSEVPIWYRQKIDYVFGLFEKPFELISPGDPDTDNKHAARALWGGIHGICQLSLTGKLDMVGVDDVKRTMLLLVRSFLTGWAGNQ